MTHNTSKRSSINVKHIGVCLFVTSLASAALGCASQDPSAPAPAQTDDEKQMLSAANADQLNASIESLRAKISVDATKFRISEAAQARAAQSPLVDAALATASLQSNLARESDAEWVSGVGLPSSWEPTSGQIRVEINDERGTIALRDGRGYSVTEAGTKAAEPAGYQARSRALLEGVVANMNELSDIVEAPLIVSTKTRGIDEVKKAVVGTKVFVERRVMGVRVENERLVFSYASDGSFRKLIGSWKRLDYTKTVVPSRINGESLTLNGAKALAKAGITASEIASAEVSPVFVAEALGGGVHRLALRAKLTLKTQTGADSDAASPLQEFVVPVD